MTAKDFARAGELLDPEVDFRALTPNRAWEASGAEAVVSGVFPVWLEESDEVQELLDVETGRVSDRERVAYRFRVRNGDGEFLVEQQAYYTERDGRIDWLRILCSGFRPA